MHLLPCVLVLWFVSTAGFGAGGTTVLLNDAHTKYDFPYKTGTKPAKTRTL